MTLRTWIEIDTDALEENSAVFRRLLSPKTRLLAVVKSNAYGHGSVPCARLFEKMGADFLGVDAYEEALELRQAGIRIPILVLGFTLPAHFERAAALDIRLTISNMVLLDAWRVARVQPKIHIKVDTGLNRQGFLAVDRDVVVAKLKQVPKEYIEGIYTHFAAAESLTTNKNYTAKQIDAFVEWEKAFRASGLEPIAHTAASAAGLVCSESHFGMIRAGISLYGLWPSPEIAKASSAIRLRPALTWKSVVGDVKPVPVGSLIGYDCTEAVKRDSTIAIVPVGYWHGFPRHLSGKGEVLIGGKRAKVLGRVSMDMIVVDVTEHESVATGDEVVLIGRQGNELITAEEVATKADTINYEIVTRINPLIPRLFVA